MPAKRVASFHTTMPYDMMDVLARLAYIQGRRDGNVGLASSVSGSEQGVALEAVQRDVNGVDGRMDLVVQSDGISDDGANVGHSSGSRTTGHFEVHGHVSPVSSVVAGSVV